MATDVKPRSNRLLVIVGIAIALVASGLNLALSRAQGASGPGGGARTEQVVIATKEIPAATQLTKEVLGTLKFSSDQVPPGAFPTVDSVVGKFSAITIHQNQVLADNLVVQDATQAKTPKQPYLDIPKGQVAMQIPTGELVGVGGYVQPEDRIDIIVTQDRVTKTAFKNLRILRVGPAGSANTRGVSSSFTVTVPLPQAEELKYLIENLSYKYVLKSVQDYDKSDPATTGVTKDTFTGTYGLR